MSIPGDCQAERSEAQAELSGADEMSIPGDWHLRSLALTSLSVLPSKSASRVALASLGKKASAKAIICNLRFSVLQLQIA